MSFRVTWDNLLDNVEELSADATLLTPLSQKPFYTTDVQQHRVLIEYRTDSETVPLQREQFETLFERVADATGSFDLDRLPPGAEPYATVMSLHPRFTIDDQDSTLSESETPTSSPLVDTHTVEADEDTAELQAEIEELEQRINELTSFAREHLIIPVQLVSSQHPRR
jgi:hypothetical protein